MGEGVRVLVADDQAIVRDGLVMILGLLDGIEVVGTAADGEEAVRAVGEVDPDVVLMDLHMPRMTGVEATDRLGQEGARARVVVLTTYSDDEWMFAALRAGALGYLTKDATPEEIRSAIVTVAAGQAQLDPSVQRRLLEALGSGDRMGVPSGTSARMSPADLPAGLTAREGEVLVEVAAGLSNSEIAAALFVSEATVKTHINRLLAKTAMRDRAQLVGFAYRHGLARD
jgi:DNA-binding NarL/FixJ family response regulator